MWPFNRKSRRASPAPETYSVDLDRDTIPLDDPDDVTSLMLRVTMHMEYTLMGWDEEAEVWVFTCAPRDGDLPREFRAARQVDAVHQAAEVFL
jgi:hypothetical protein